MPPVTFPTLHGTRSHAALPCCESQRSVRSPGRPGTGYCWAGRVFVSPDPELPSCPCSAIIGRIRAPSSMRTLSKVAAYSIIGLLIAFAIDSIVFEVHRLRGSGMGAVAVDQFVAGSLKGNKTEFDYIGTVNQTCSQTLFPQYASWQWNPPCWWLQRHRAHWERVRIQQPRAVGAVTDCVAENLLTI